MLGSLSIVVAHHMYAMPPYPYITDYDTSLFTHHMWIGGFCVVGGAAAAIFMVRDYTRLTITIIY
jgi:photosystem I P700 chlorophyll a apoprotein A1